MNFLDRSEAERRQLSDEIKRERQKKLRQTQWAAGILGSLFLVAIFLAYFAWRQTQRAEENLTWAQKAVDESLSSAGSQQAREASDAPQMEEFRKGLLDKAQIFYTLLAQKNSTNLSLRIQEAEAHSRLGDINRLTGRYKEAAQEYNEAVTRLTALAAEYPIRSDLHQALAYSHNWLGETIRAALDNNSDLHPYSPSDAEKEYGEAIRIQEALNDQKPENAIYQQELARTYYNRGIIRFRIRNAQGVQLDFRRSIDLLEPLVSKYSATANAEENPDPAQDLARVYNDYAIVVSNTAQTTEAQALYEKAIALAEQLVKKKPENREYKMELAQYYSNEARMLAAANQLHFAEIQSQRALELVEQLAVPTPLLSTKMAETLQLRGELLQSQNPAEAKALTDSAFDLLNKVDTNKANGALYMNIGANYLELAQDKLQIGDRTGAAAALSHLDEILPHLSVDDKKILAEPYQNLQRKLKNGPTRH
jgi:tetratricopeptide (TPR) repeat protein